MQYVYSTLANDVSFNIGAGASKKTITIAGQANVMNPRTLLTPRSAGTAVDEKDLVELEKNKVFKRMSERGYLKPVKSIADPEVVAKDLSDKDKGKQLTNDDVADNLEVSGKKGRKKAVAAI